MRDHWLSVIRSATMKSPGSSAPITNNHYLFIPAGLPGWKPGCHTGWKPAPPHNFAGTHLHCHFDKRSGEFQSESALPGKPVFTLTASCHSAWGCRRRRLPQVRSHKFPEPHRGSGLLALNSRMISGDPDSQRPEPRCGSIDRLGIPGVAGCTGNPRLSGVTPLA